MLSARRAERGFGVAEVLLASSLVLMAVLGATRATVAGIAAEGRATARERATIAVDDALDVLRTSGCLLLTGAETADDARAVAERCRSGLGLPSDAPTGGGTGTIDAGGHPVEVSFASRWIGPPAGEGISCADARYAARPTAVERRIVVTHREAGRTRVGPEVHGIEAAPADRYTLRSWWRSNLVVAADPAASVDLLGPAGVNVRRIADPNGCVWFPALRTASYTLSTTRGTGAVATTTVVFTADARRPEPVVVMG